MPLVALLVPERFGRRWPERLAALQLNQVSEHGSAGAGAVPSRKNTGSLPEARKQPPLSPGLGCTAGGGFGLLSRLVARPKPRVQQLSQPRLRRPCTQGQALSLCATVLPRAACRTG